MEAFVCKALPAIVVRDNARTIRNGALLATRLGARFAVRDAPLSAAHLSAVAGRIAGHARRGAALAFDGGVACFGVRNDEVTSF